MDENNAGSKDVDGQRFIVEKLLKSGLPAQAQSLTLSLGYTSSGRRQLPGQVVSPCLVLRSACCQLFISGLGSNERGRSIGMVCRYLEKLEAPSFDFSHICEILSGLESYSASVRCHLQAIFALFRYWAQLWAAT